MPYKKRFKGSGLSQTSAANIIAGAVRSRLVRKRYLARRRVPARGYLRTTGFYGRFQGLGGPELKFFDTSPAAAQVAATGTITSNCLNIVPQADTESSRQGRLINIKSIYIKGAFILPTATSSTTATDDCRFILYQDMQANGAAATAALILAPDPSVAAVSIDSFRNLENVGRFKVLWDKLVSVTAPSSFAVAGATPTTIAPVATNRIIKYGTRCSIPITFDSTAATGALTTVRSNNLGILCVSRNGLMFVEYNVRIRYSDQ